MKPHLRALFAKSLTEGWKNETLLCKFCPDVNAQCSQFGHVPFLSKQPLKLKPDRKTKQETTRTYADSSSNKNLTKCRTIPGDSCAHSDKIDPDLPQPRVVIIGAGMAGLSAAEHLAKSGLTNFIVLEGTDRPGGRIHSCWMGDTVGELGAQWIKGGSPANPIYNMAAVEGLLTNPLVTRQPLIRNPFLACLTSEGHAIELETARSGLAIYEKISNQAFSLFSIDTDKGHGTLKNFLFTRMTQELASLPSGIRNEVSKVIVGMFNTIKTRWGQDISHMGADNFGSFIKIPGPAVRVPLGFIGILGPLLKAIPKNGICYCSDVKKIIWDSGSPRAIVKTTEGKEHPADYVLITVSLGVLKSRINDMFTPDLPDEKGDAIQKLGFGHLNKIILEYCKPFWAEGEGTMVLAWSASEIETYCNWTKGISVIEELPGNRNMLMTTVAGEEAMLSESLSDEDVAVQITDLIRQFTGDSSIPYPINLVRSKWSSDKFFKGAITNMVLDSSVKHQCELGKPTSDPCGSGPPVLLFAGEATTPGQFSTVQGARLSGIREAGRIVSMTKQFRGPPREDPKQC